MHFLCSDRATGQSWVEDGWRQLTEHLAKRMQRTKQNKQVEFNVEAGVVLFFHFMICQCFPTGCPSSCTDSCRLCLELTANRDTPSLSSDAPQSKCWSQVCWNKQATKSCRSPALEESSLSLEEVAFPESVFLQSPLGDVWHKHTPLQD